MLSLLRGDVDHVFDTHSDRYKQGLTSATFQRE